MDLLSPDVALTSRPDGSEPSQKTEIEFLVDLLKEHRTNPTKFLKKLKKIGFKEFEHTPFGTDVIAKMEDYGFLLAVHHLKFRKQNTRRVLEEKLIYFKNLK